MEKWINNRYGKRMGAAPDNTLEITKSADYFLRKKRL